MRKLVFDLPTRLFHWFFAGAFVLAFVIAKTFDEESAPFPYHMILGILLFFLVFLRLIWAFVGSPSSRFSSFEWSPQKLFRYFYKIFQRIPQNNWRHNPASSWASVLMFVCAIGLASTGFFLTRVNGSKLKYESLHEFFAHSFLFLAAFHILGVSLHSLQFRDSLYLTMFDGKKVISSQETIQISSKKKSAWAFVIIVLLFSGFLVSSYDSTSGTLKIFGQTLILQEIEEDQNSEESKISHEKFNSEHLQPHEDETEDED